MSLVSFEKLSGHARLWAFTSGDELTAEQRDAVGSAVREFLSGWAAHGAALTAGFDLLHNRFLVVGVDEDETAPSGCSIDAMTRFLKGLRDRIGVDFLDAPECCFRAGDEIRCVDRSRFRELAKTHEVGEETTVFDLTIPRVQDLTGGKFETSAGSTWFAKAFPLGTEVDV